ncbi:MAG: TM2 domain-containing protein [Elusimicrobiaceae bacterium]|nr:TM2 domain-containing protein [Elusimicrobiaceae bacterium]
MALVKCKECGKDFSDMAISCPNCGYNPELARKREEERSFVPEDKRRSKITAGFLCLFLWGLGAHEFYLGNANKAGAWIFWNVISCFIASIFPVLFLLILIPIICSVKLWTMPTEKFDSKYNKINSPKNKLGWFFLVLGLLIVGFFAFAFFAFYK